MFLFAFPTAHRVAQRLRIPIPNMVVALAALVAKMVSAVNFRIIYGSTEAIDSLHIGEAFESILELCLCWVALEYVLNHQQAFKQEGH